MRKVQVATVLIDSNCPFCSKMGYYISKYGNPGYFDLYSIYSGEGERILKKYGFKKGYDDSIVVISKEKAFIKSAAVFEILRGMDWGFKIFAIFKVFPTSLLDKFYDFIAKNRNKL